MYDCFKPGKIWYDTSGKRIQAHGGSIIFAEDQFWWYGENKDGITGMATGERCPFWHHGVKLYSSDDLYNWTDEGFCVIESQDINSTFHPTSLMDRPHILYNKKTGYYVLWAKTAKSGDFGQSTFSICRGKSLKNMRFVKEVLPTPYHAGDFDLFEFNGKAYVVYENPHSEMIVQELTEDYQDLTDISSAHLHAQCPPFVREAPAVFEYKNRLFMITSGTTGYYPNASELAEITDIHGEWKVLGNPCKGDVKNNSFHAQFSSVFKHPKKQNTYIALGDRWLVDLPEDLPDMGEVFYNMCGPNPKPQDFSGFSDENTSVATYVWLRINFDENYLPYLVWNRKWSI